MIFNTTQHKCYIFDMKENFNAAFQPQNMLVKIFERNLKLYMTHQVLEWVSHFFPRGRSQPPPLSHAPKVRDKWAGVKMCEWNLV